jgi:uncharacterized repeat protein (TIGR03803 family)
MSISFPRFPKCAAGVFVAALVLATGAFAQVSERVLYNFPSSGPSGSVPTSKPLLGSSGQLYGVANTGGNADSGTAYELTAPVNGVRTYHVLHQFSGRISDARNPIGTLVSDAAGNIYGAALGGANGLGAVFKLTPGVGSAWTESIIYSFGTNGNLSDGTYPAAGLTIDAAGNLYGTTYMGGTGYGAVGTVYELTPNSDGTWTESLLHSFSGNGGDGELPEAELVFDGAGNLYGTTTGGGAKGFGTVFELSPISGGGWTEEVLYSLPGGKSLQRPQAPVWLDGAGNIYGTAAGADTSPGYGGVFELIPNGDGTWTQKSLHLFGGTGDGQTPTAGLTANSAGSLFGTTVSGGANGFGILYVMQKNTSGQWIERTIYNFSGPDGSSPFSGLTLGRSGVLYGVTVQGGSADQGTVYQVTP